MGWINYVFAAIAIVLFVGFIISYVTAFFLVGKSQGFRWYEWMIWIALFVSALFLGGCVNVGEIQDSMTGAQGQHCVPEGYGIGDKVRVPDGRIGTVEKLEGRSNRCPENSPIRAVVSFN